MNKHLGVGLLFGALALYSGHRSFSGDSSRFEPALLRANAGLVEQYSGAHPLHMLDYTLETLQVAKPFAADSISDLERQVEELRNVVAHRPAAFNQFSGNIAYGLRSVAEENSNSKFDPFAAAAFFVASIFAVNSLYAARKK